MGMPISRSAAVSKTSRSSPDCNRSVQMNSSVVIPFAPAAARDVPRFGSHLIIPLETSSSSHEGSNPFAFFGITRAPESGSETLPPSGIVSCKEKGRLTEEDQPNERQHREHE